MYSYRTQGTCAREIYFELDGDRVGEVTFVGGCNGNLKAVAKLIHGMPAQQVIDLLQGNDCGGRGTSCADQLTKALALALEQQKQQGKAAGSAPAAE